LSNFMAVSVTASSYCTHIYVGLIHYSESHKFTRVWGEPSAVKVKLQSQLKKMEKHCF